MTRRLLVAGCRSHSNLRAAAVVSQQSLSVLLVRHHGGHAHDHHHPVEIGWSSPSQRITLVGLASNIALTGGKAWAGVTYGSAALVADALHSASDMLSDLVTLTTLRLAQLPASPRFPGPHGLQKVEPMGAFLVSGLLAGGGLSVGWSSLQKLLVMLGVDLHLGDSHGHAHGAILDHAGHMPVAAFYVALATILAKEALFRATWAVAKREDSALLRAQAWHHRSDALSTLVAVVGVGGATAGYPICDPLGGLLVSVLVARAGYSTLRTSAFALLDAVDPVAHARYRAALAEIAPSVSAEGVSLQRRGGRNVVVVEVESPTGTTLGELEDRAASWTRSLREHTGEPRVELRIKARCVET